jgi:hypothetical protein
LRRRLTGWAATILAEATEARPAMPAGVDDRDADVWEPLLALADIADDDWPKLARKAAVALVAAAREIEPSLNIRLLADLRVVFGAAEQLTTKELLADLHKLEDAPWGDLKGKPLSDNQLARRLRQYDVKPRVIRVGNSTPRGYMRADLHDVWRRYLPPSEKPATAATAATSQSFQGDSVATPDFEAATEGLKPQHSPRPDVAAVASENEGCCGSPGAGNADEMGIVAPVAPVAASVGNGGGGGPWENLTFLGVEPFKPCVHCGKTGGVVHHVRDNCHLERPSAPLHEDCVAGWFAAAAPPEDDGSGLSPRTINELADAYRERSYAQYQEGGGTDVDHRPLDSWLRQHLAELGVFREHVEIEFARVMEAVFAI